MQKYGVPQVSSGDLLRDAVARGTELGLKAKAVMDSGALVSDAVVLALIRERLSRPDAQRGFILDGFPRNITQAKALRELLDQLGQPLEAVLLMSIDPAILLKRLTGRRCCARCGRLFNIYTSPPTADTPCIDGGNEHQLVQRPDDHEDTIRKRLDVYAVQTRPLIDHYRAQGLLRTVDAEGDVEQVLARLERAVQAGVPERDVRPRMRRSGVRRRVAARRAHAERRRVTVRKKAVARSTRQKTRKSPRHAAGRKPRRPAPRKSPRSSARRSRKTKR